MKVKDISEKLSKINTEKFVDYILNSDRLKSEVVPLFSKEEYKGCLNTYKWKCNKCNNIFESTIEKGGIPRCLECYPLNKSMFEVNVSNFCKQYFPNLIENDRNILEGYELDIYIPEINFAVECNGVLWHSEYYNKYKDYHLNKTLKCQEKDIKLIHIFEDEWYNKQDIVKSILLSKMGKIKNKIHARKCVVRDVDQKDAFNFLEDNHIQGNINGKHLGLYHNDKLVSILSYSKSRFEKDSEYEILRFCNIREHIVNGSFSKLFKHILKTKEIKSWVTYADSRYGDGEFYKNFDFEYSHLSDPNYFYYKIGGPLKRESRNKFQKHKLKKILEKYDENLSEVQNMNLNNYVRIWDCGNHVYKYQGNI